ncbi:MAG TPA: FAD-dependent oxidoreductase, partial [Steroidobacteraceae bacterium]|nr:FAD-dependent oxidoreductase [Steroidobacteraceae bacterium]
VLVAGAGTAGLAAACRLGESGLRVVLAERDVVLGGGSLLDARWSEWREAAGARLASLPAVRCLPRTTVLGAYGHGVFGLLESLDRAGSERCGALRERLWILRVKRVLLATGAAERLIAFPGNDLPGVMLAGAAASYLRRYGVAIGHRPAFFLNNDAAYEAVFALAALGVACAGVIDPRERSLAADRARGLGIEVHAGAVVAAVSGWQAVRTVSIAARSGAKRRSLEADSLGVSGGYTPATALAVQLGAPLEWRQPIAAFTAALEPRFGRLAGAVRGLSGLAAAAQDGASAAAAIAAELGRAAATVPGSGLPPDPEATPLEPLWEVAAPGKAFVDLQNDVTTADVRLACREGYRHVEHMKRFTTHGMATDQGRIGGLLGSAVLAAARGEPLERVGESRPRPFATPVPFAALAGGEVGPHYRPRRRLPLHEWHEAAGATFASTGLWLRPLAYAARAGWDAVLREARTVRASVGLTDVSTLGKLDVQGPDAGRFLDFVYANTFSTLAVGRARYGIMLREDGMLLDDGTTSRLAAGHFLLTTTTANAAAVLEHLEFHLQTVCRELDVVVTDVADQWAQFAVAGPRARAVVTKVVEGLDLSNEAFPFMAVSAATIAGIPGRVFRISFSGELAYELAVPAAHALTAWTALLEAGRPFRLAPYGLDALNTLRIEKGHVTTAELNGNTTAADLGLERLLKKSGDFIGRTLALRPGLTAADRLQLVGVRPLESARPLRNGMQLLAHGSPAASEGYLTSCTPSVEFGGWIALALLAGGRRRLGERLLAVSPVHGLSIPVEITSAHRLDPENLRVRS